VSGSKQIIREVRSDELESPPLPKAGVYELCAESILDRRAQTVAAYVIQRDSLREARVPG
jgi:hypothetical protein